MAREGEGEGSCIKPLCSKVSRTFSHGDSSRLITNSKASSPTGGNTQPRLFVPVLLPLLRPTFRCFRNEIGPLLSPFPSHRPQTCYCSSLIRDIIIEVSPNPDSSIWKQEKMGFVRKIYFRNFDFDIYSQRNTETRRLTFFFFNFRLIYELLMNWNGKKRKDKFNRLTVTFVFEKLI